MKAISILVIVPTLNSYKLLNYLIKSLEEQTFKNWKLLLVDGKSNKEHIEYLKKISKKDPRISWISQKKEYKGIFGAMNQGVLYAKKNDWVMFWGSDDRAFDKNTFKLISETIIKSSKINPYLIISKCKYFDIFNSKKMRNSFFLNNKLNKSINRRYFSFLLFMGASPPHQGTVFSPRSLQKNNIYNEKYDIAADIKFFLELSSIKDVNIYCMSQITTLIGSGGISSILIKKKIKQVINAYFLRFKFLVLIPFLIRYFKKSIDYIVS